MSAHTFAISGSNGFVGKNLCMRLAAGTNRVIAVGGSDAPYTTTATISKRFNQLTKDDLPPIDVLIHLAAINNTLDASEADLFRVNVDDSLRLFDLAASKGCQAIVYASSIHIYGPIAAPMSVERSVPNPVSAYGRSKLELERAAAAFSSSTGIPCIGLRLANVYGPGEAHKGRMASQVTQLAHQIRAGHPVLFEDGTQVRDFVFVDDVAEAFDKAAAHALAGHSAIFNCGSGSGISFNELVATLGAVLGFHRKPRYIPQPPNYLGEVVLDIKPTVETLQWHPRPVQQGIQDYLASAKLV